MKIAVDLDGVVFDTENWFRAYANIFNLFVKDGKVIDKDALWVEDKFNWDKKTFAKYVEEVSSPIEKKAPVLPFAKEVLSALKKRNKVIVITGRGCYHENEEKTTRDRLEKERMKFDEVLFNQKSKVAACLEHKVDLAIEDYPENALKLAKRGIKCIYFRDATAKKLRHKNIIEVRDWGDVAVELVKMNVIKKEDIVIKL